MGHLQKPLRLWHRDALERGHPCGFSVLGPYTVAQPFGVTRAQGHLRREPPANYCGVGGGRLSNCLATMTSVEEWARMDNTITSATR